MKSFHIRSYSGPYFPAFGINTERYGVFLSIQSECGKMWTGITPNTDTSRSARLKFKTSQSFGHILKKVIPR